MRRLATRVSIVALTASIAACSYDINRLRGICFPDRCEEASVDASQPEASVDDGVDIVATDATDDGVEAGDFDAADVAIDTTPACDFPGEIIDLVHVATRLNATTSTDDVWGWVVNASTTGGTSMVAPPPNCIRTEGRAQTAPERIYRYVVQHGPTLVASTEAPLCRTNFDTIVSILRDCPTPGTIASSPRVFCNDDSERLQNPLSCESMTSTVDGGIAMRDGRVDVPDANPLNRDSARWTSSTVATDLSPGDVVYIVVDGWQYDEGNFRLQVVENAARVGISPVASDRRCRCAPPTLQPTTFRLASANGTGVAQVNLSQASQAVQFLVNVPTQMNVVGLSARLKLGSTVGSCSPVFDVNLSSGSSSTALVHTFQLDPATPRVTTENGGVFTVPLQTFDTVVVPQGMMRRFSVNLRTDLTSDCPSITFDVASPANELTLYVQN